MNRCSRCCCSPAGLRRRRRFRPPGCRRRNFRPTVRRRSRSRFGNRWVSAWDTIRAAAPVWPEAAAFPEWDRPVAVVLERIAETERVVREAASARLRGRTVIAAYSPAPGELLPDPAELAEALARLASLSDGFALAYHRSGAHVRTPSEGELAFLAAAVRSGNPGIALFGEAYFGELASGHRNRLSILSPPGSSGVLLFNAARPTAVTSALIEEVARETRAPGGAGGAGHVRGKVFAVPAAAGD